MHSSELALAICPRSFYVVGVECWVSWIHELQSVIHCLVIWKGIISSPHRYVFGSTCCCIMGNRVAADLSGTATIIQRGLPRCTMPRTRVSAVFQKSFSRSFPGNFQEFSRISRSLCKIHRSSQKVGGARLLST